MKIEQIAKVAHETNRAYCITIGDNNQPSWQDAPEWQKSSAINGIAFRIANPDASASAQHEAWLKNKISGGWKYGEVKDPEKKEHPCCVQYNNLPMEQKVKDALFIGIVHAMKVLL